LRQPTPPTGLTDDGSRVKHPPSLGLIWTICKFGDRLRDLVEEIATNPRTGRAVHDTLIEVPAG